jgi:predicted unusual protein kinase regulating ubiquinone biosynthesis (AarF/ABC1/UbiB family)
MARGTRMLMAGVRSAGRLIRGKLVGGDTDAHWAAVGEDWFRTLGEMKGAAMKLGQLASQYADVLPPGLAGPLARLQKDAAPRPWAEMLPVLQQQWSPTHWQQVGEIAPDAVAAASIGQVHRATLKDGRAVAVKIRYPGVAEAVDDDVATLGRLLRMGKLLTIDGPALDALLDEVRVRFREETDYRRELGYLQQLRAHAAVAGVIYPQPVPALCTEAVLVTEWTPAPGIEAAEHYPQAVRDALGTFLLRWSLHQMWHTGAMHADPHAGNFGFHDDGRLTVYDFGCVRTIDPAHQQQMARIADALRQHDWPALHDAAYRLGGLRADADDEAVRQRLYTRLLPEYRTLAAVSTDRLFAERPFDFADAALIEQTRTVARDELRLWLRETRPIPPLAFVGRALSGHYWLLRRLRARVDVVAVLDEVRAGAP